MIFGFSRLQDGVSKNLHDDMEVEVDVSKIVIFDI